MSVLSQEVISGHCDFSCPIQQLISTFPQQGIPQSSDENSVTAMETAMKAIKPIDMYFLSIPVILQNIS